MKITLVTIKGEIFPYRSTRKACKDNSINERTVYAQFERQGYYDKNGIRIEKKEVI